MTKREDKKKDALDQGLSRLYEADTLTPLIGRIQQRTPAGGEQATLGVPQLEARTFSRDTIQKLILTIQKK